MRRLTSGAEALAAGGFVHLGEVGGVRRTVAVAHAVEARQVGAGLGRGDDVVGRQGVFGVRQADLDAGCAELFDEGHGGFEARQHAGLDARRHVLGGNAEAQAVETFGGGQLDLAGQGHRRRVAGVVTGDAAQQQGAVVDRARERPDLVERAREGDEAVARHGAVGGLHAHDAAQRRRLADGAAGVGAQGPERLAGGHRGGGAARRAAGHGAQVPGVVGGAEGRVLGRRAHGELVHVGLAQHDDVIAPDAAHRRGGVDRLVVAEHLRAAGGGDALGDHVVFDGGGQAGQGAARGAAPPGRSRWRTWRRCRRSPG